MIISASEKTYIVTNGTSTVFTGEGTLANMIIGSSSAATLTLLDGTTPFGYIDAATLGTFEYNAVITSGLYVVASDTPSVTVTWRK